MAIEWGMLSKTSYMGSEIIDNSGAAVRVLRADMPFTVNVSWNVPAEVAELLNSGHQFRLRAYAESMGPGPERQLGGSVTVPAVWGQQNYPVNPAMPHAISVPAGTLLGEGQMDGGVPVSGTYRIMTVLQLMNGGETSNSGFSEGPIIQVRHP